MDHARIGCKNLAVEIGELGVATDGLLHGARGATLQEVATAVGLNTTSVTYYFRRKEDIYSAVLERTLEIWLDPLERLDADGDPEAELSRYIAVKLQMSADAPEASRLFANEILHGAPVIGDFLSGRLRRLVGDKAAIIERWMDEGRLARMDPVHLVFMIWAITQHYADFAVQVRAIVGESAEHPAFRESTTRNVLALVMNGLRPRSGDHP